MFSSSHFRKFFPQLERKIGLNPFIYFDNGASTLKHNLVTDRINTYNRFETSNVHRGAHMVSRQGTVEFENARSLVKKFINSKNECEIIFTKGTTEGINLVASVIENLINENDEILITPFEHHSNIVPWQILCQKKKAKLKIVPFDPIQGLTFENFKNSITEKTRICSMIQYSNSFGQRLPIEQMISECRKHNILTLVDGAQTPITEEIDVQKLNCDFFVFSGHKMFGPYGIGILYGRKDLLEALPPYQTGGSMIDRVTFEKTTYADLPQKYEAGTPPISGAIGLGVAIQSIFEMNIKEAHNYVFQLRKLLIEGLKTINSCELYEFPSESYAGIVSFNIKGAHPSDVGTLLDKYGIAVRTGHHCTQPLMDLMGIKGTVRASLAPYNSEFEIDYFVKTLKKVEEFF
jgi:cysteine desulfurase / selenocysteine lyase